MLCHIGRRKDSVKLNKTPCDLQPVAQEELVACTYKRHLLCSQSFLPLPTWFMQQEFSSSRTGEGEWWALAITRGYD